MALAPNLARGRQTGRRMTALTGFVVDSLNIPSGHPRKKLPKPLDIKISLTHLFPGLQTSGSSPPPPWANSFTCCLLPARPGRRQASGNACGMNKGLSSFGVPQDGPQEPPSQLSSASLPPLPYAMPCHTLPISGASLTLILCPVQLNHKFVNFFLIHNT